VIDQVQNGGCVVSCLEYMRDVFLRIAHHLLQPRGELIYSDDVTEQFVPRNVSLYHLIVRKESRKDKYYMVRGEVGE
jgi:hypothetical protein